jgi:hypothetical protein
MQNTSLPRETTGKAASIASINAALFTTIERLRRQHLQQPSPLPVTQADGVSQAVDRRPTDVRVDGVRATAWALNEKTDGSWSADIRQRYTTNDFTSTSVRNCKRRHRRRAANAFG